MLCQDQTIIYLPSADEAVDSILVNIMVYLLNSPFIQLLPMTFPLHSVSPIDILQPLSISMIASQE